MRLLQNSRIINSLSVSLSRIWEYLVDITNKKNIAVIITTHYIEECKQAHKVSPWRGRWGSISDVVFYADRFDAARKTPGGGVADGADTEVPGEHFGGGLPGIIQAADRGDPAVGAGGLYQAGYGTGGDE